MSTRAETLEPLTSRWGEMNLGSCKIVAAGAAVLLYERHAPVPLFVVGGGKRRSEGRRSSQNHP